MRRTAPSARRTARRISDLGTGWSRGGAGRGRWSAPSAARPAGGRDPASAEPFAGTGAMVGQGDLGGRFLRRSRGGDETGVPFPSFEGRGFPGRKAVAGWSGEASGSATRPPAWTSGRAGSRPPDVLGRCGARSCTPRPPRRRRLARGRGAGRGDVVAARRGRPREEGDRAPRRVGDGRATVVAATVVGGGLRPARPAGSPRRWSVRTAPSRSRPA